MITVIKLGGSLLNASALPACLAAAGRYAGNILIVPGGGVFADQVRSAQKLWDFDDSAAHRMAILAMQQMALLFNSLQPTFALFHRVSGVSALPNTAIWSPSPDELDEAGVEASWDVTSDSLAAWLAGRVGADELILVKSCMLAADMSLFELQQQGIIDAGFSKFAANAAYKITVINKERFLSVHDQIHQVAAE